MVVTLSSASEVDNKAGNGLSTTITTAIKEEFINQAEAYLNVLCRYDFIANYTNLNANIQKILNEAVSNLAAIYAVQYNVSGYSSSREAESIININWARFTQVIKLLQEQNSITFMKGL